MEVAEIGGEPGDVAQTRQVDAILMATFGTLAPAYAGGLPLGDVAEVPSAPIASKWKSLPSSENVVDRRDNNEWFRAFMSDAGMALPQDISLDQIKRIIMNPMTPPPQWADQPLLPQGPLSRAAGYDDVGRPEELKRHFGTLAPIDVGM